MRPETKLWHDFKKHTTQISWTRLENSSVLGTPDLLGYNTFGTFLTVELKVISGYKLRLSPHQIAFHVKHPQHTFILAWKASRREYKMFPGSSILTLVKDGFKSPAACDYGLVACGLYLQNLQ